MKIYMYHIIMDRNILFHMLRYAHTEVNTSVKSQLQTSCAHCGL